MLNQQDSVHLRSDDWERTIYIPCDGVGAIDFDITDSLKLQLLNAGTDSTTKYIDSYADPKKQKEDI